MKKLLLFLALMPTFIFGQTNYTSTGNGDFLNPLTWNPLGVPTSGDSVTINHAVVMNTDIYYTAGRITIGPNGSLIEDATDRAFWADGDGSLINNGTFTAHLLLASPSTEVTNMGSFSGVDSVWNQGTLINGGVMDSYDLLNDETGVFQQNSSLLVTNNMNNQGLFQTSNSSGTTVSNDFSNCNLQTMDAMFINNGVICIGNNFANCAGDTLKGTGVCYIGGSSSNLGVITGTLEINTPTGALDIPGTVTPMVTFNTGICDVGIEEELEESFNVYPNPTSGNIYSSKEDVKYQLFDITGKVVGSGTSMGKTIQMDHLKKGVYLLKVNGQDTQRVIKQ